MATARKGKIARLPFVTRERINEMLLDNVQGQKILNWLNADQKLKGAAAITDGNLSEWRKGGFQDWLEKADKMEKTKRLSEICLRVAKAGGGEMDLPAAIAGGQIMEALEGFDPEKLKLLLQADPANYIELLESLSKLQRGQAATRTQKMLERQNDLRLAQNERSLHLAELKAQDQELARFKKWYKDQRAMDIMENKRLAPPVQMQLLRELMFGPVEPEPQS